MNNGEGFIVKSNKGFFDVFSLASKEIISAKTRGVLRHKNFDPIVGDHVIIEQASSSYSITEILPRKNELIRPKVANIDCALIFISVKEPNFQSYLLDKYLSVLTYNSIEPIIIFSKLDLLEATETAEITMLKTYYQALGYPVFQTHHGEVDQPEALKVLLDGKIASVIGQTGVGKSTFINAFAKEDLQLETSEISQALGRGKHTTRIVELYPMFGGWIADTPGFSSFHVDDLVARDVSGTFIEFAKYPCKFQDCAHQNEQTCGVKKAVEAGDIIQTRYDNFVKIYQEVKTSEAKKY